MSNEKIIFSMAGVSKIVPPNKQILKNIYLSFFYGAKIGVIGFNGAGKSTLLRVIAGVDKNIQGEVVFSPGYSVGFLEQEPILDGSKTVKEIVQEGVQEVMDMLKAYEDINLKLADPDVYSDPDKMDKLIEEQGRIQEKLDAANAWDIDSKLERAMDALRCPPEDALIQTCSGGEKRRVALCRLLLQEPDVLLLDEPTNHLDAESVHWLQHHLREYKGTVILVTHDRYFLDNVTEWILELDRGEGIPWKANYSSWLEQKQNKLKNEEKSESQRQKALQRELDWVRQGAKGRQAKQKARLKAYEEMSQEDVKQKENKLELFIPPGPRLGDKVIEAVDVAKSFGDRLLYENLTFSLPRNGIVGIIGPNGAGKTTLFRMIMGQLQPDAGHFETGETVNVAYFDQEHAYLDPEKTVWETISGGNELMMLGTREVNSRAYVSRFNFGGSDQNKKIKDLSGGERNRVHLALTLKAGGNLLLLDEPTNDLDINTLRALEDALNDFAGCAVIISHDRWFLDRVATHILAFEGNSQVKWFEGSFSDYMEDRRKRIGDEIPKRLKYKKLK
jgi:ATP-binding cassette ChvD family protein